MLTLNVRDTRQRYSEVNRMALLGLEVVTKVSNQDSAAVSHINKEYLDYLLNNCVSFTSHYVQDEEIGGFTVVCDTLDFYGEGETLVEAIDDLVASTCDYLNLFKEDPELYAKFNTVGKNIALLKLLRCQSEEEVRRAMCVDATTIYPRRHSEDA